MVWLVYLIRSFVCMDILGASGFEAFSIFCYCEGYENPFYGVFMFSLCGIIYISVGVLMNNNTIFDDVFAYQRGVSYLISEGCEDRASSE